MLVIVGNGSPGAGGWKTRFPYYRKGSRALPPEEQQECVMEGTCNQGLSLREQASAMRRLSNEHAAADHQQIAAKLADFAAELETKAGALERLP